MASSSSSSSPAMAVLMTPSSPSLSHTHTLRLSSSLPFSQSQILSLTPKPTTRKPNHHYCSLRPKSINPKPQSPSPLSQLEPYLLSEWKSILQGWACSAASVYCLSLAVPSVAALPRVLSTSTSPHPPFTTALKLASLTGAQLMANYAQEAFLWKAALSAAYRIRVHIFNRVLLSDLGFFEGTGNGTGNGIGAGDVSHRITTESADVADMLFALLNTIVPTTLQLIAMSVQMISLSPLLSILSLSAVPFMSFIISYLGKILNEISRESNLKTAQLSAYLNEVLPFMLVVKANNGERKESLKFRNLANEEMIFKSRKKKIKAFIPYFMKLVYIGGLVVICAGFFVISGESFDSTKILSFSTALSFLIKPLQDVGKAYNELKQGEPAIERLFHLTKFKSKVMENPNAINVEKAKGDIKFIGVKFKYENDDVSNPLILNGVNIDIKSGEKVAIVGPSGSGKSTLAKLLLRLYDPLCGDILLDGCNIRDIKLECLRKHISLVLQDTMLFCGTVAENIAYRVPIEQMDMVHVINAAKIANAHEFIESLSEKYETNIGQRGSLLSGGQKQRLAIARAVYQNSSVLILDEATSALDSKSELLVRQALERLMYNRTVIIIAHRMETIEMADRVLVLEQAKLREVEKSHFCKFN